MINSRFILGDCLVIRTSGTIWIRSLACEMTISGEDIIPRWHECLFETVFSPHCPRCDYLLLNRCTRFLYIINLRMVTLTCSITRLRILLISFLPQSDRSVQIVALLSIACVSDELSTLDKQVVEWDWDRQLDAYCLAMCNCYVVFVCGVFIVCWEIRFDDIWPDRGIREYGWAICIRVKDCFVPSFLSNSNNRHIRDWFITDCDCRVNLSNELSHLNISLSFAVLDCYRLCRFFISIMIGCYFNFWCW